MIKTQQLEQQNFIHIRITLQFKPDGNLPVCSVVSTLPIQGSQWISLGGGGTELPILKSNEKFQSRFGA